MARTDGWPDKAVLPRWPILSLCLSSGPTLWSGCGPPPGRYHPHAMADKKTKRDEGVLTQERPKTKKPPMYKVLIHNDDYTPMEFVVAVLIQVFRHDEVTSNQVMLHVHRSGIGVAGVYPYEVAETKVAQVLNAAKNHEYPLQCSCEVQ
jgi:ATP-dependent Clp protease adaptor protein ClpS